MSNLVRVTCTLPLDAVRRADGEARRRGRSRSWVVAEALRRLDTSRPEPDDSGAFEQARDARRSSDLRLSPEQRVLEAEELSAVADAARRRPTVRQVVLFEDFESWFAWKKQRV